MTERWCIPANLSSLFVGLSDSSVVFSKPVDPRVWDVRVVAPARRTYQGKQARRAAFYNRQRMARHLQRVLDAASWAAHAGYHDAMRDALVYGMGVLENLAGRVRRVDPTDAWR